MPINMKSSFLLLVVLAVYTASAVPVEDPKPVYSRFFEFTDLNGNAQTIDLEEEPDMDLLNRVSRNPKNCKYLLFTRKNPDQGQELVMNDAKSIRASNFNSKVQTIVMAHGWNSDQESGSNEHIKDVFLRREDANFIILDWSHVAGSSYVTAVRGVPNVGRSLGEFLKFLNKITKASYDKMHLIGFSLGAHLVGNAGRELEGKVARVTGLDPAGPLWVVNSDRLSSGDAQYVEAIHTDGDLTGATLGLGIAIADADFFPNGGNSQPGCLTSICSHNFAWRLFAASVTYDHLVGRECSSRILLSTNLCRGDNLNLGNNDLKKTGSGMFRVNTGRRYPF